MNGHTWTLSSHRQLFSEVYILLAKSQLTFIIRLIIFLSLQKQILISELLWPNNWVELGPQPGRYWKCCEIFENKICVRRDLSWQWCWGAKMWNTSKMVKLYFYSWLTYHVIHSLYFVHKKFFFSLIFMLSVVLGQKLFFEKCMQSKKF